MPTPISIFYKDLNTTIYSYILMIGKYAYYNIKSPYKWIIIYFYESIMVAVTIYILFYTSLFDGFGMFMDNLGNTAFLIFSVIYIIFIIYYLSKKY